MSNIIKTLEEKVNEDFDFQESKANFGYMDDLKEDVESSNVTLLYPDKWDYELDQNHDGHWTDKLSILYSLYNEDLDKEVVVDCHAKCSPLEFDYDIGYSYGEYEISCYDVPLDTGDCKIDLYFDYDNIVSNEEACNILDCDEKELNDFLTTIKEDFVERGKIIIRDEYNDNMPDDLVEIILEKHSSYDPDQEYEVWRDMRDMQDLWNG